MAYGNSNPGEGEDMYSDAGKSEGGEAPHDESKEEKGEEPTALLPKSVLGGKTFKPGEEVVLEVVEVRDSDVIVKYASEGEQEKGGEKEGAGEGSYSKPEAGAGGSDEMTSMME